MTLIGVTRPYKTNRAVLILSKKCPMIPQSLSCSRAPVDLVLIERFYCDVEASRHFLTVTPHHPLSGFTADGVIKTRAT